MNEETGVTGGRRSDLPRPATAQGIGRTGEEAAAQFLLAQGYVVLAKNQRTPVGELDLVCQQGGTVVMVEVKARTSEACGAGLEAIGPRKARRLRAAAAWWLAESGRFPCPVRFDAIVVGVDWHGWPRELCHFQDILRE